MDSISYYSQTVLNGILAGCIYALFAMGLTLIYGVLNFVNFAHGELIMWGAYFLLLFMAEPFGLPLYPRHPSGPGPDGVPGACHGVLRVPPHTESEPPDAPDRRHGSLRFPAQCGPALLGRRGAGPTGSRSCRARGSSVSISRRSSLPSSGSRSCVSPRSICCFSNPVSASRCAPCRTTWILRRISGIDTKRAILAAWVISAVLAGIGGILMALDTNLHPEMGVDQSHQGLRGDPHRRRGKSLGRPSWRASHRTCGKHRRALHLARDTRTASPSSSWC